jgi:hypothetical protein
MSEQPKPQGIDLETFLASAGRAFTDAQKTRCRGRV